MKGMRWEQCTGTWEGELVMEANTGKTNYGWIVEGRKCKHRIWNLVLTAISPLCLKSFQLEKVTIRAELQTGQAHRGAPKAKEVGGGFAIFWLRRSKELNIDSVRDDGNELMSMRNILVVQLTKPSH